MSSFDKSQTRKNEEEDEGDGKDKEDVEYDDPTYDGYSE
jgi:hypothetical protein